MWSGLPPEVYGLECGVRQDGLTSPILFGLYTNCLIFGLGDARIGCTIDDVLSTVSAMRTA